MTIRFSVLPIIQKITEANNDYRKLSESEMRERRNFAGSTGVSRAGARASRISLKIIYAWVRGLCQSVSRCSLVPLSANRERQVPHQRETGGNQCPCTQILLNDAHEYARARAHVFRSSRGVTRRRRELVKLVLKMYFKRTFPRVAL